MTAAERGPAGASGADLPGLAGWGEQNGRYLDILAVYNRQRPLPRGYAMQAGTSGAPPPSPPRGSPPAWRTSSCPSAPARP